MLAHTDALACLRVVTDRAADYEERLIDAAYECVLLRAVATSFLQELHAERKLRRRCEERLREVLDMPADDNASR
jgi:hypothetical protein